MFQHGDAVGRGKGHSPARSAFAHHDGQERHANFQTFGGGAGNRLGLTALFRALAGIGAGRVDQGHNRQVEAVGQIHQPHRLAIALRPRHAKVALDPGFGVMALFMADHHHGHVIEPRDPAHHCMVIGKAAVAGKRGKFGEEPLNVILGVRAVRMARNLAFLPWGQRLIEIFQEAVRLAVQRLGFFRDVHGRVRARQRPQFLGLAFNLGEWLFEIQIVHRAPFRRIAPIWPEAAQDATRPGSLGPILPLAPDPARSDAPHGRAHRKASWPPCCRV